MTLESRHQVYLVLGILSLVAIGLMLPFDPQQPRPGPAWLTAVMEAASIPGVMPWNGIAIVGGLALLVIWIGWKIAGYLALITAVQGLVTTVLKIAFPVERPNNVDVNAPLAAINNAFPSGHVIFYVVFFGFLFYLIWAKRPQSVLKALVLLIFAILITLGGVSRIYLGTHWFVDVAGAQVIGFVLLAPAIEVYQRYVEEQ